MSRFNVSVIVVNYNCHKTLNDCIRSILLSKGVGELLLVDNSSTDGSLDLIEKCTDVRLKIIRLPRNVGLAKARNLAVTKAKGNYIAFTDADSVVDPDWLQVPCFLLETHKEIGAVQCKVLSFRHPDRISFAGNVMDGSDWVNMPKEMLNFNRFILFPIGACIITRGDVWDHVLGFDPAFFVGHEDIDFGIRLWPSGYAVVCSSQGVVYHDGGHDRSIDPAKTLLQSFISTA